MRRINFQEHHYKKLQWVKMKNQYWPCLSIEFPTNQSKHAFCTIKSLGCCSIKSITSNWDQSQGFKFVAIKSAIRQFSNCRLIRMNVELILSLKWAEMKKLWYLFGIKTNSTLYQLWDLRIEIKSLFHYLHGLLELLQAPQLFPPRHFRFRALVSRFLPVVLDGREVVNPLPTASFPLLRDAGRLVH